MEEIIRLINAYWKFDNDQQHLSTWHDKQDLLEAIRQAKIWDKPAVRHCKNYAYLIQYDINMGGEKDLIMLVYGESYDDAVINLKKAVNSDGVYGNITVIRTKNLTVE